MSPLIVALAVTAAFAVGVIGAVKEWRDDRDVAGAFLFFLGLTIAAAVAIALVFGFFAVWGWALS